MRSLPILLLLPPCVSLAAPVQLQHQARLLDAAGGPLEGTVTLELGIYADGSALTPEWSESQTVQVHGGYVSLILGADTDDNPLDDGVFDGSPRYVGLSVDGDALHPRQLLATLPHAVFAQRAVSAEFAAQADHAETATQAVTATHVVGGDVTVGGLLTLGSAPGDTCSATGGLRFDPESTSLQLCDGEGWVSVFTVAAGQSPERPASTCKALKQDRPDLPTGRYWLEPPGWSSGPFEALCDMDTDGGGWMLTYKMRNDGGDSSPNYFVYIDDGAGTSPPTDTGNAFAVIGWYEGPTAVARWSLWGALGATEYRGVTYGSSGTVLMDVKSSTNKDTGNTWFCAATGCGNAASVGYSNASMGSATSLRTVSPLGLTLTEGQSYSVYNHGHYGCNCWEGVFIAGDYTTGAALFTDHNHSGRYLGDYTAFWIR